MNVPTLPVSRKFYNGLISRVLEIANAMSIDDVDGFKCSVMRCVDCYLGGGNPEIDCSDLFYDPCRIVFIALKAELDRAIIRSREARKRALRRRRSDKVGEDESSTDPQHIAIDESVAPATTKTRRTRFGLKISKVTKGRGNKPRKYKSGTSGKNPGSDSKQIRNLRTDLNLLQKVKSQN